MSKRKPKTHGLEWLYLSMASFNGSGYADKTSAKNYLESYIVYKAWKRHPEAIRLAKFHALEALEFADKLYQANEPGHIPGHKQWASYQAFKSRAGSLL